MFGELRKKTVLMPGRWTTAWAAGLVWLAAVAGCTPEQYARWADLDALRALFRGQDKALGKERKFDVAYQPYVAEAPRKRDAPIRVGDKTLTLGTGKLQKLGLDDCLTIAFRNSRDFQDRKEQLYGSALALANASRSWDFLLLGGAITAMVEREKPNYGEAVKSGTGDPTASLTRRFVHGGVLALSYALSVVTDFAGSANTTAGSLLDANFTQPLLRGAWHEFAYEDQYRLERNFLFAVFDYERFTQTFGANVVTRYYDVLRQRDAMSNDEANIERLKHTFTLTSMKVKAGEASPIQQDQAEQNLLDAQIRLERNRQSYQDDLDQYKISLRLAVETDVELDYPGALASLNKVGVVRLDMAEPDAIATALSARPDVLTERSKVRDAIRNTQMAADLFYPELNATVGISAANLNQRDFWDIRFDRFKHRTRLDLNYALDQTDNRDAYRRALLAEDKARRDLALFEDNVRLGVRQSYRSLQQSRRSHELSVRSVHIAKRRQKLAVVQQKAGEASARDVLEAEDALRVAQNGLTAALVTYTNTRLSLLAKLGMLAVDEKGKLHERSKPEQFDRIRDRYPYVGGQ